MADNQHQKIKGYRDLTESEIASMNECKQLAIQVGDLCSKLATTSSFDQRWIAIGKTDLQKGFMALVRGIAKPETF